MYYVVIIFLLLGFRLLETRVDDFRFLYYQIFILIILVIHSLSLGIYCEDSFIVYRYIDNFVRHGSIVFNNGEFVEGYSDFFWLLIIALFRWLLPISTDLIAPIISLCMGLLTVCKLMDIVAAYTDSKKLALYAGLLLATSPTFALYSWSGLENSLFSLVLLFIFDNYYKKRLFVVGILLGLAVLIRPEAIILILPVSMSLFLSKNKPNILTFTKSVFLPFLLIVVTWRIWAYWYYGFLIPNTMAAKSGMDLGHQIKFGFSYFVNFIKNNLGVCFLFFSIVTTKLFDNVYLLITTILAAFTAVYILLGGDWMPGYRFFSWCIPLIILSLFLRKDVDFNEVMNGKVILVVSIFSITSSFVNLFYSPSISRWSSSVKGLENIGVWFEKSLAPKTTIAVFPIGALGYNATSLNIIDMGGLTDSHIGRYGNKNKFGNPGHIASDFDYVVSRRPLIIADLNGVGYENQLDTISINGYTAVTYRDNNRKNTSDCFVNLLVRNDSLVEVCKVLSNDQFRLIR